MDSELFDRLKESMKQMNRMIESVEGQGSQTVLTLSGSERLTVEQIQTKIKETVEKLEREKQDGN